MADTSTGAIHTNECIAKGPGCSYTISASKTFLLELGHARVILQTDGEPAILSWAEEAVRRAIIGEGRAEMVSVQAAPRDSHASNGAAERSVALVRNQAKAFLLSLDVHTEHAATMGWQAGKFTINNESAWWNWASRHAAWLSNRYQKRRASGNITPYEKYRGRKYQQPLVLFGCTIMGLRPGAHLNKAAASKLESVWLGRDTLTDAHICATAAGIYRTRAIRCLTEEASWNVPLIRAMQWTPWRTSLDGPGRRPLPLVGEPFLAAPLPTQAEAHAPPVQGPADPPSAAQDNPQVAPAAASASTAAAASSQSAAPVPPAQQAPVTVTTAPAPRGPRRPRKHPLVPSLAQHPSSSTKRSAETPIEELDPAADRAAPFPSTAASSSGHNVPAPVVATDMNTNYIFLCEVADVLATCDAAFPEKDKFTLTQNYSDLLKEARQKHLEKLSSWKTYARDSISRVRAAGEQILSVRWVDSGTTEVKSRLVTRGYEQEDPDHTFFAATPSSSTLKVVLVLAAVFGWSVEIGDAESAFLQADYEGDAWVHPPPEANEDKDVCWKVLKILPGLRGGPRVWGNHATTVLADHGFVRNGA